MSNRNVIALNSEEASSGKPDEGAVPSVPQVADNDQLLAVFSNHHDASTYCKTAALKELLDQLVSGLHPLGPVPSGVHRQENQSVYLVKGEKGCGKSAFLRWFMQQAPADWEFCHVTTGMALGEKHLVGHISKVLFPGQALDIQALTAKIKLRARNGAFMVIVVDDAEMLSPFALKSLLAIKEAVNKRDGRLGIVMCATEAIQSALATPSLAALGEDFVRTLSLPRISSQQLSDYIQHRLKTVGADGQVMFTPRQLGRIYKISRGLPKSINLAVQDFLQGRESKPPPISLLNERLVHYRVFLLSLTGFGLILGGGYTVYRSMVKTPPLAVIADRTPVTSLQDLMLLPSAAQAPVPQRVPAPVVETPLPAQGPVVAEPMPPASDPVQQKGELTKLAPPPPSAPPVKIQKREQPIQQSAPVLATPTQSPPPQAGQTDPDTVRDSAWVLAQDSSHFTVQLTSWEDENRARKYIEKNGLINDAAYVHTRSKGKDWYLVIYKAYPGLKQARQGINELPSSLKKYGPWVRNISSLQAEAVIN